MALIGQQIEIHYSKLKLLLLLLGALTFVSFGLWFIIAPPTSSHSHRYSPTTMLVMSYASIIFFGLCALIAIRKLFDNRPGLIIDELGLKNNSSGFSGGQINWSDVSNISVIKINRQKLIMLELKNPQDYINKQTSAFKRKIMKMSFKKFGGSLSFSSSGLKISFADLHKLIVDNYDVAKQREEKARTANTR